MIDAERARTLERDIVDLRVANGELTTRIDQLSKDIDSLSESVQALNRTINQGKGALLAIVTIAGAAGSLITVVLRKVVG